MDSEHIQGRLQIAAFTLRKYIDIICNILANRNKLFSTCISIFSRDRLQAIIEDFRDITSLPNICGLINDMHILLADRPNRRVIFATSDFFNRKKFHSIVLQGVMQTKFFGMYVLDNLDVCTMEDNSKFQICTEI
jgi:hypothetical protein